MNTFEDKTNALLNTKESIRLALEDKGVPVSVQEPLSAYASKIDLLDAHGSKDCNAEYGYVQNLDRGHLESINAGIIAANLENYDVSYTNNLNHAFNSQSCLSRLNVTGWNTSHITSMNYTFRYAKRLRYLNLSSWDVSNVNSMTGCFMGIGLKTLITNDPSQQRQGMLNLTGWNTGNVTNLSELFYYSAMESLDMRSLDLSNVTSIDHMVGCCYELKELRLPPMPKVATLPKSAFEQCPLSKASIESIVDAMPVLGNKGYIWVQSSTIDSVEADQVLMDKARNKNISFV